MAIKEYKDKSGKIVFKYEQPDWEILYHKLEELLESYGMFIGKHSDLTLKDTQIITPLMAEILIRIDKRKDYFMIFHDDTDMNEIKESALLAYWLIKFKPIKIINEKLAIKYQNINENFALFVMYSALKGRTVRTTGMKFRVSKGYTIKISYAFKYWDLSKESLMLIAETLCEAMYV